MLELVYMVIVNLISKKYFSEKIYQFREYINKENCSSWAYRSTIITD